MITRRELMLRSVTAAGSALVLPLPALRVGQETVAHLSIRWTDGNVETIPDVALIN